ncbi:hypothetical protein YC2023_116717 [Brassica napus]
MSPLTLERLRRITEVRRSPPCGGEALKFKLLPTHDLKRRSFHHICSLPTTKKNVVYVTPFEKCHLQRLFMF